MSNLIKKFFELKIEKDLDVIDFIQNNKIEKVDYFALNLNHKEKLITILIKYCFALNNNQSYEISLNTCKQLDSFLEHDKKELKKYHNFLEDLLLCKGIALSKLKEYHQSNRIFKKLMDIDSENDRYFIWYKSNKRFIIEYITNPILVIGIILTVGILLLEQFKIFEFNNLGSYIMSLTAIIYVIQILRIEYLENAKILTLGK